MFHIAQFPEDNYLWVVKWVDEFRLAHAKTRAAAVNVLLQRLPFDDPKKISGLSVAETQKIFGNKFSDPEPTYLYPFPRVHVGTLPLIPIGAIFRNKQYIGTLPQSNVLLDLPKVEESCTEHCLETKLLEKPVSWGDFPYRVLNSSEFGGVSKRFALSKCLLHKTDTTDYIIPRIVIFTRFYGCQPQIARAFSQGPWPEEVKNLIFFGLMDSGLETRALDDPKQWNIILQTKIHSHNARLLAILYFDEYGHACASAIYSNALQDRGANRIAPWYASARIPFRSSEPLQLRLTGYFLKPEFAGKDKAKRKRFLVTKIIGCSQPSYIPPIEWNSFSSNETGPVQTATDEPKPYGPAATVKNPSSTTSVDSDSDFNIDQFVIEISTDDFSWLNAPPLNKLKKQSSKKYLDHKNNDEVDDETDSISTGSGTHQQGTLNEGQINELIRNPELRFEQTLKAMQQLQVEQKISRFYPFQPIDPSQLLQRGSRPCWSFLNEESRNTGVWPLRDWRLLEPGQKRNNRIINGVPRSALIIAIEMLGNMYYWLEIECRPSESYKSIIICPLESVDIHDVLTDVIETTAHKHGRNLEPALKKLLKWMAGVAGYTHRFTDKEGHELCSASMYKVLARSSVIDWTS